MKIIERNNVRKRKHKKNGAINKERLCVVAQEIKLARLLSGNEKKKRDRVLKTLKKWLSNCFQKNQEFKEGDFTRVWKGLFYAVWMSDKPLIQEDLCEDIAGILDIFPSEQLKYAIMMTKAGFKILATEWYGIDHHRMDKFLMLVRRYLRGSLCCLLRCDWSVDSCTQYAAMLGGTDGLFSVKTPHYARNATSLMLHIADCYLEEIAKVSQGSIPEASLVELLRPFCVYMQGGEVPSIVIACKRILLSLLKQSDIGLQYQEATKAWQLMGYPEGGPEALELVVDDEDGVDPEQSDDEAPDPSSLPLDPRAGRVDVVLPTLPVPTAGLVEILKELLTKASSKSFKRVQLCIKQFERLAKNDYPLRIPKKNVEVDLGHEIFHKQSIESLDKLDKTLKDHTDELALRGLSRKHRKRLLAKSRAGHSIIEDVALTNTTNGAWQVELTEQKDSDISDKENRQKQKKDKKINGKRKLENDTSELLSKKQKVDSYKKPQNKDKNIIKQTDSDKKKHEKESSKAEKNKRKHTENNKIKKKKELKKKLVNDSKDTVLSEVKDNQKDTKPKQNGNSKMKPEGTPISENTTKFNAIIKKEVKLSKEDTKDLKVNASTKQELKLNGDAKIKFNSIKKQAQVAVVVKKIKNYQKPTRNDSINKKIDFNTPKKVKFVLKNNSMQKPVDYYKSVRQSPNIPFDSNKKPEKTNLKVSTPSPINPFFKKKMKSSHNKHK